MAEEKLNVLYYFTDKTVQRHKYTLNELIEENDRKNNYRLYIILYGQIKKVDDILVQTKDNKILSADEYIASQKTTSQTVQRITTKKTTTKATGKTSK